MTNGKVTLAVLGSKMDILTDLFKAHAKSDENLFQDIRESLDGCDEYPGVRGRLDRLEQKEKSRSKHVYVIYTSLVGLIFAVLGKFLFGW